MYVARWGPQQPLLHWREYMWAVRGTERIGGWELGEGTKLCLLCSVSCPQSWEQCLVHSGCSNICRVTLRRHKHIHAICENVKYDCIGGMCFWDPTIFNVLTWYHLGQDNILLAQPCTLFNLQFHWRTVLEVINYEGTKQNLSPSVWQALSRMPGISYLISPSLSI